MKRLISISLACLILLQSCSKLCIYVAFKLNQNYIAKTLCINRDKPEKKCCGKCYLKRSLKADEEQNNLHFPPGFKNLKEALIFCEKIAGFELIPAEHLAQAGQYWHYQAPFCSSGNGSIFKPPQV